MAEGTVYIRFDFFSAWKNLKKRGSERGEGDGAHGQLVLMY